MNIIRLAVKAVDWLYNKVLRTKVQKYLEEDSNGKTIKWTSWQFRIC